MEVNKSIFRENDIRGIYPEQLNEFTIGEIGKAIAIKCKKENIGSISVGRDGRLSGESLLSSFCDSLINSGINVTNIGMVTSPMLYFEAKTNKTKSGIIITGSHNPKNHNGLKMVVNDRPVSGIEILSLIENMESEPSSKGELRNKDIKEKYLDEVVNSISIRNPSNYKVVIDCGNGAAGCVAPDLFKRVGCEVVELFTEVDGNFPNHHPDPSKLENLQDLIDGVISNNADLGLAFDGDGDRVGLITNTGENIFPDKYMMMLSENILSKQSGSIVFDVKCSNHLAELITKNNGVPVMAPTGHFHIKRTIKENNALLGGEMSGHIFFNDKWYGFDDGPYSGARIIEALSEYNSGKSISDIIKTYPKSFSTPELNIDVTDENKFQIVEKFIHENKLEGEKNNIDGLRVNYKNGWGLIRASNTSPKLVLRFEGNTIEDMHNIQSEFLSELARISPDIVINLT
ncbi:phosphomannomutase/phosphoglucomutase [Gammaproteobacteria bacterium]|jgi:phosphomannomutase|nr:phosphomannomutase/phosphoglucomutase [Gammaproteobacteria bacterium]MDC3247665.1 phosphomannomutase/phosphoglucomutase [Gammaproteobacteria bacterium]MDC3302202.1 phosphomannomutase/phosphoglucomutase [Gammaproteobacteria bacterium]